MKKVGDSPKYLFPVYDNSTYVAEINPVLPDKPTVSLKSTDRYIFGYTSSQPIVSTVALPADSKGETKIIGYEWYQLVPGSTDNWTLISGESGSSIPFPLNKEQGSYTYRCIAIAQNINNLRTIKSEPAVYTVIVDPDELELILKYRLLE